MNPRTETIEPPSRLLQWLEFRAAGEFAGTLAAWPLLHMAPRGDGHAQQRPRRERAGELAGRTEFEPLQQARRRFDRFGARVHRAVSVEVI